MSEFMGRGGANFFIVKLILRECHWSIGTFR